MKVESFTIVWQDARKALSDAGFIPLTSLGRAEHWVRDNKRVILYLETEEQMQQPTEKVKLHGTAWVEFIRITGHDELIPIV